MRTSPIRSRSRRSCITTCASSGTSRTATASAARLAAFVVERFPFAIAAIQRALDASPRDLRTEIQRQLRDIDVADLPETTPGVAAQERWNAAVTELLDAVDGFLAREAIAASLTKDEKLEMMRGMVLMRALEALQGERYLRLAERRPASEAFLYGWLANRIGTVG